MRLLIDEAAFAGHPQVRAASLRRAVKEWGITEYASIWPGQELAAAYYAKHEDSIKILFSPEAKKFWEYDNEHLWLLERAGFPREKYASCRAYELEELSTRRSKWALYASKALLIRQEIECHPYTPHWQTVGGYAASGDYSIANRFTYIDFYLTVKSLPPEAVVGLDFETVGPYPFMQPDGFSLSWEDGQAVYFPMKHEHPDIENIYHLDAIQILKEVVYEHEWTAHNAKFEYHTLLNLGLDASRIRLPHDTLALARLIGTEKRGLKFLAGEYLNHDRPESYKDLTNAGAFASLSPEVVREYACSDADDARRLYPLLQDRLTEGGQFCYENIDRRLIPVLVDMERQGLPFDRGLLTHWHEELESQIQEYTDTFFQLVGVAESGLELARNSVNLSSPRDINFLLFDHLGLEPQAYSARGYKTDQRTIDVLKPHPAVEMLELVRQTEKLDGTYARGLLEHIAKSPDGLVHPTWNAGGTKTGRMSSSNPNGQNVPPEARAALIAPAGYILVGADYGQIELRCAAALAGEERYLDAFKEGRSPHLETMQAVFGHADKKDIRRYTLSKNINFAVLFGGGPDRLVEQAREGGTRVERTEVQRWLDINKRLYLRLWAYRDDYIQKARRDGYAETVQGRRTYLPNLRERDPDLRAEAERQAFSVHIQGTCGLFAQEVMCEWYDGGEAATCGRILLNVHDEIVILSPEGNAEHALEVLVWLMKDVAQRWLPNVPIEVEGSIARTWKELK